VDSYVKSYTVRWSDCDANGHVRNTAYSEFTIESRMAFLTEHGFGYAEMKQAGFGPVLLREEIDYFRECHLGEEVSVTFSILGLSEDGARFKMAHDLWKPNGKQAARVVVVGGWMDLTARRLAPPPAALREALEKAPRGGPFETLANVAQR
jgi:acyl-CoA thioester hydrolase